MKCNHRVLRVSYEGSEIITTCKGCGESVDIILRVAKSDLQHDFFISFLTF